MNALEDHAAGQLTNLETEVKTLQKSLKDMGEQFHQAEKRREERRAQRSAQQSSDGSRPGTRDSQSSRHTTTASASELGAIWPPPRSDSPSDPGSPGRSRRKLRTSKSTSVEEMITLEVVERRIREILASELPAGVADVAAEVATTAGGASSPTDCLSETSRAEVSALLEELRSQLQGQVATGLQEAAAATQATQTTVKELQATLTKVTDSVATAAGLAPAVQELQKDLLAKADSTDVSQALMDLKEQVRAKAAASRINEAEDRVLELKKACDRLVFDALHASDGTAPPPAEVEGTEESTQRLRGLIQQQLEAMAESQKVRPPVPPVPQ